MLHFQVVQLRQVTVTSLQTSEEIEDIFIGMSYQVVDGFEVDKTTTTLNV